MMFKTLTLQNLEEVRPYLMMLDSQTCDFTVGGMFMWRDYYKMEYAIEGDCLYSRLFSTTGDPYYNLPLSADIRKSLICLLEKQGLPLKFCTIPEKHLSLFLGLGKKTVIFEQKDFADYLYLASDLANYPGKKYHGQRNLVNQFTRKYENWNFDFIDKNNIDRVKDFFFNVYLPSSTTGATEFEENKKVLEAIENNDAYNFVGGILTIDDSIVGFTLNEIKGSTLFTHIEKADRRISGAYQMLVKLAASFFATGSVEYINREEDMGDLGLRQSKESYHPIKRLKKYVVEVY